jgi:ribosomal protein S18 acetylase RimI-like enzyme
MPFAVCLPMNKMTWDIPSVSVKNNIVRCAQTMSELCENMDIVRNVLLLATRRTDRSEAVAHGSVLWALLDGEGDDRKVLALAMVNLISNLTNLCVLPEHRGKGFAKMLINEIST